MPNLQNTDLQALGYEVRPSSSRPGWYQWRLTLSGNGQKFPPIDRPEHFPSEEKAWDDARQFQKERVAETASRQDALLSSADALAHINEVLNRSDGAFIACIYNQLCDGQIEYVGDSLFKPIVDTDQQAIATIEKDLQTLGVAICCDIADELDSKWYSHVCNSAMPDEQFMHQLAQRLHQSLEFNYRERFASRLSASAPA